MEPRSVAAIGAVLGLPFVVGLIGGTKAGVATALVEAPVVATALAGLARLSGDIQVCADAAASTEPAAQDACSAREAETDTIKIVVFAATVAAAYATWHAYTKSRTPRLNGRSLRRLRARRR
jgi:hypothetical protein